MHVYTIQADLAGVVRQCSVFKQKTQHTVHAIITSKLQKYTLDQGKASSWLQRPMNVNHSATILLGYPSKQPSSACYDIRDNETIATDWKEWHLLLVASRNSSLLLRAEQSVYHVDCIPAAELALACSQFCCQHIQSTFTAGAEICSAPVPSDCSPQLTQEVNRCLQGNTGLSVHASSFPRVPWCMSEAEAVTAAIQMWLMWSNRGKRCKGKTLARRHFWCGRGVQHWWTAEEWHLTKSCCCEKAWQKAYDQMPLGWLVQNRHVVGM